MSQPLGKEEKEDIKSISYPFLFLFGLAACVAVAFYTSRRSARESDNSDSLRVQSWNGVNVATIERSRQDAAADFPEFFAASVSSSNKEEAESSAAPSVAAQNRSIEAEMLTFFYLKDLHLELRKRGGREYASLSTRQATIKALNIDVAAKSVDHPRLRSLLRTFDSCESSWPLSGHCRIDQHVALRGTMSVEADLKDAVAGQCGVADLQTVSEFLEKEKEWKKPISGGHAYWQKENIKEIDCLIPAASASHGSVTAFRHFVARNGEKATSGNDSISGDKKLFPATITAIFALQHYARISRLNAKNEDGSYVSVALPDITTRICHLDTSFLFDYLFKPESRSQDVGYFLDQMLGIDLKDPLASTRFSLASLLQQDEHARKAASIILREKLAKDRAALISVKLTPAFEQKVIHQGVTRFEGARVPTSSLSADDKSMSAFPSTTLLVIGHRRGKKRKDYFLLQNWTARSQFFEADVEWLMENSSDFVSASASSSSSTAEGNGAGELLFVDRQLFSKPSGGVAQGATLVPTAVISQFMEL